MLGAASGFNLVLETSYLFCSFSIAAFSLMSFFNTTISPGIFGAGAVTLLFAVSITAATSSGGNGSEVLVAGTSLLTWFTNCFNSITFSVISLMYAVYIYLRLSLHGSLLLARK